MRTQENKEAPEDKIRLAQVADKAVARCKSVMGSVWLPGLLKYGGLI